MDKYSNRLKIIIHGCCYFSAISTVEASTILPVIVNHFTNNTAVIGIFTSLLRGGAVIMLLYAAFQTQSYKRVMPYLFRISFFRTIALGAVAVIIFFLGEKHQQLTLWLMGITLFCFSFISGFGTVYFNELIGKIFTNSYRGVTMAHRQFFGGLGGIATASLAAWYLKHGTPPQSFAYIFGAATIVLATGYFALNAIDEFEKENISKRENGFNDFLKNAKSIFLSDRNLRLQVTAGLLSYSFMLGLPYIVINAGTHMGLGSLIFSSAVPIMAGAMFSNIIWGRFMALGKNKEVLYTSFVAMALALILALFKPNIAVFMFLFFIAGCAIDGFKLAFNNIILNTAPELKRPVYVAIQVNLVNLGLFFAIPGGILYGFIGFHALIVLSILMLGIGCYKASKIKV